MTAIKAVYDGKVFIPKKPFTLTKGSEVTITIRNISNGFSEKQKKLAAFRQLTREINESNKTEPLPEEFDNILTQRIKFKELVDL